MGTLFNTDNNGVVTVTNDLTADTSTLKVDANNHYVGIGTTTPAHKLDVAGSVNISSGSSYKINGTPLALTDLGGNSANILLSDTSHTLDNAVRYSYTTQQTFTGAYDLVDKTYVDSIAAGLHVKDSVRLKSLATDGNIALSGTAQTLDGVTPQAGWRVLLNNQSSGIQNGIWVVSAGAWTRPTDFANGSAQASSFVYVEGGSQADTGWVCTNNTGSDVVGTDPLTFSQFNASASYTAGSGLALQGTVFSLANVSPTQILVGAASTGVLTAATVSGDITLGSTGVAAIASNVIVNSDVNSSAAIDGTKISPNFGSQNVVTTGQVSTSTFKMTTGAGASKVLVSDASGNGSWTTAGGSPAPIRWLIQGNAAVLNKVAQVLIDKSMTIDQVISYADTAPSGASLTVTISVNGSAYGGSACAISSGSNSGASSGSLGISVVSGDRVSLNITSVGSTTPGGDDLLVTVKTI